MRIQDIATYVFREFKVKYSISGMTELLHRLNYTYKKPKNCVAAYGQIKKGKVKELRSKTGRHRLNVNGDISIKSLSTVVEYGDSLNV